MAWLRSLQGGLAFVLALSVAACDSVFGPGDDPTYEAVTRLTTVDAIPSPQAQAAVALAPGDVACAGSSVCVTPENLEGRVYAGGVMVGGTDESGPGYLITTVGATPEVRLRPDQGKDGEMTFNIRDATDLAGGYTCCGGTPYPTDEAAIVNRLEFMFDYLDATFTVPAQAGPNVAGNTYTLRFVYVTETTAPDVGDGGATVRFGDILVKEEGESSFQWCDQSHCDHDVRPEASPFRWTPLEQPEQHEQGNPSYAVFPVPVDTQETITFTESEALEGDWLFTVAFDLTNALAFSFDDWNGVDALQTLLANARLYAEDDDPSAGLSVHMTKAKL